MIRSAKLSDLDYIWALRLETSALLKQRGIDQWQYHLPDKKTFIEDIELNEFFLYEEQNEVIGMISIKSGIEPTYNKIYEGVWTIDKPYLTIHRLAISKNYLGSEIAKKLILFAHQRAKDMNINYIRIDTHEKNKYAIRLFNKLNYQLKGYILLNKDHPGDPKRLAYDCVLDEGEGEGDESIS